MRAGLILNADKTEIYNFKELGALRGPDLTGINILYNNELRFDYQYLLLSTHSLLSLDQSVRCFTLLFRLSVIFSKLKRLCFFAFDSLSM
jgi:hypothetical protein